MTHCHRCQLPETAHGPELAENGLCSFCRILESHQDTMARFGQGSHLLQDRLAQVPGKRKYDCLAGLSGGKDSSYVVYRLKSHYGARVLAFTWDNGFLTDFARQNIERIVREFQVDHVWVKPDHQVVKAAYRKSLEDEGWPCSACYHFAEATAWRLAYQEEIPFIVGGRTPEQILRAPAGDAIFQEGSSLDVNMAPHDTAKVEALARQQLQRFRELRNWLLPDRRLWKLAERDVYLPEDFPVSPGFAPEMINLFLLEPYSEERIINILESETSWRRENRSHPLGHDDCSAHDAAGYLYRQRYGLPFVAFEVASLVRQKKITTERGRQLLRDAEQEAGKYPRESMAALARMAGLPRGYLRVLPWAQKIRLWLMTRARWARQFLQAGKVASANPAEPLETENRPSGDGQRMAS